MPMTSSPEQTTLGHSVGSDAFVHQIAAYARNQAVIAEQATGGEASAHVAALNNFAEFLTTRGPRDQRIYALWKMAVYSPDADAYLPGEGQAELFGKLGTGISAPLPESTLNELIAVAVDDLLETKSVERAGLCRERDAAVAKSERADAAEADAATSRARIGELEADLGAAGEQVSTLTEQIEHLRRMVPQGAGVENDSRRRVKVPDHTGVYSVPGTDTYEIGWRHRGKQKWKVIGPDLAEAVAAREALVELEAVAA
jgi:hypothetical protein